ncbi:alpha-(1,3)-fucosyltransferase 10 [Latimeria chalumnae]|uniref:alpha-(1,3)-fucosyltransferase 10 n=1 Tax=Latimeria chalumnae TaxID=7897 RepID=UPI0003C19CC9|nr:PREDICTED: alpha-(1,3)-fucosyltransferase 10 [Latimeria chalumnae]|eukprot:XP_006013607.1 PREDICTED: alpha-(1,3)-fucosyltransferase 10 [Latimeria chalumnae]
MARLRAKKLWLYCFCFTAFFFLLITLQVVVELGQFEKKKVENTHFQDSRQRKEEYKSSDGFPNKPGLLKTLGRIPEVNNKYPILLWWSPLTGETGKLGQCGIDTCFFTINKTYQDHLMTKAFLFYGTDFNIDSLPLPRRPSHEWALFHEESPKNNYKLFHEATITMFNHTATFSQHSHLPLTTQYLESIEALKSHKYLIPLSRKNDLRQRIAPLVYVQSDCDPPSDRDSYVRELMKYIVVDSYGDCLHNKDLPQHLKNPTTMDDEGFYEILAQYKFILAFENAVCEDYITEKFWRPLKLGVVPVYYGSCSIAQWLPNNKSAILVSSFSHPKELAKYIKELDNNDQEYEAFLKWKWSGEVSNKKLLSIMKQRKWGVQDVTQDNYIDVFECLVCNRVWENIRRKKKGLLPTVWQGKADHLSCPKPEVFNFILPSTAWTSRRDLWISSFEQSKKEAQVLRQLVKKNENFTTEEFWKLVFKD